jgi:hypothetical protein
MKGRSALSLAALLCLGACGGAASAGPSAVLPAALVGSWQAGSACKAQGCAVTATVAGTSLQVLTDSLSVSMDLAAGGGVVSTVSLSGVGSRINQGTGRVQGNTLIIDYPGTPSDTVVYAAQGALLRFDFQNTVQLVDVTGDGVPDRLRISVLFARR